jgi:tetratricopeptide (TPR) repeat protein
MEDYREIMDVFFSRVTGLVFNKQGIIQELEQKEKLFACLGISAEDRRKIIFDWFLFDADSQTLGENPLDFFLKKIESSAKDKAIYRGFKHNIYSVFEVLALKFGKELCLRDLLTGKEYQVHDASLSRSVCKGLVGVARLLPFEEYYIATGMGHFWPKQESSLIKLSIENLNKSRKSIHLNPLIFWEIFLKPASAEILQPVEKLKLILFENGLTEEEVARTISLIEERISTKQGSLDDLVCDVLTKVKPADNFKPNELTAALLDAWNSFIKKDGVSAGPLEKALIDIGAGCAFNAVNPRRYKNTAAAAEKMQRAHDLWLKTPLAEFEGKTPEEIILKEREKSGNPHKQISWRLEFKQVPISKKIIKKAEELFYRAAKALDGGNYEEAIFLYDAYNELNPENHVVWHNLGVANVYLKDKTKAIECFKTALKLKPDYELARKKLKYLKNLIAKDIAKMVEGWNAEKKKMSQRKRREATDSTA